MTRTAVIVQARLQSTRLPGKTLLDLKGNTVLGHVLDRCAAIPGIDAVCCATVSGIDGNIIEREARAHGAHVHRGSETDVLGRYYDAACALRADVIMRVTSDCPAIDPAVCGQVLALVDGDIEYACNFMPPSWPHGLDCDAFRFSLLQKAHESATSAFDREHVTTRMRADPALRSANFPGPGGGIERQRWTLDTAEDLAFLRAVFEHLPAGREGWHYGAVLDVVKRYPQLLELNTAQATAAAAQRLPAQSAQD